MRRRAAVPAALTALGLWAGAAPAQEERPAPPERDGPEASALPRLPPDGLLSVLAAGVPTELPLGLLRGTASMVEGALRQAEGAIVPIPPDAVLGDERDPLGKTEP